MSMSVSNCYLVFEDENSEESKAADLLLARQRASVQPALKEDKSPLQAQIARALGDPRRVPDFEDCTSPFISDFILDDPDGVVPGGYSSVRVLRDSGGTLLIKILPFFKITFPPKEGIRMPKRAS